MLTFLIGRFAGDEVRRDSPAGRLACGMIAAALGIALNLFLFALKLCAGLMSGSIAITADAFNSLSDAASSLVTLIGLRLANRAPDNDHPFGHRRFEYITGLIVAMIIVLMGLDLLRSSVVEIAAPKAVALSPLTVVILLASVGVKLYMCLYNRALGRRIDSSALRAASMDSLGDMLSTSAVLLALLVASLTGLHIDGWAGLAVSLVILYAGISAARETVNPLLGEAPAPELIERIRQDVMDGEHILGMHDLIVHDYGPGRRMISLHAEVPADSDLLAIHDEIDRIERKLSRELQCDAVIHIDPLPADDGQTAPLKEKLTERIQAGIDPRLSIHDFRVADGADSPRLVFDVLAPYDLSLSDEALTQAIQYAVSELDGSYRAVIRIDRG